MARRIGWLGWLVFLGACGGGGGGSGGGVPTPTVPPLSSQCEAGSVARLDTEALQVGRSAELHLLSCDAPLDQVQWTQTGPETLVALSLDSARSQSIGVTPGLTGTYRYSVSFRDSQGRSFSGGTELSATPASSARGVLTRGEPSVWGGGSLSLRAWPQGLSEADLVGARWSWTRISGPGVTLTDPNAALLVFSAPAVAADQLLVLRATLSLADGSQLSDDFRLLVQPPPHAAADPLFSGRSASTRVYPYQVGGPYAAALARCAYHPGLQWSPNNLCTLGNLPLLGQGGVTPTIEQVMQRVLVSNDWMGEVFERFLREQDPNGDFRRLLAATTSVVIGGRVRPSFYWNTTGAIYIDASYLWLTPEQRDSVSETLDPRSANGPLLQYATPWRYVKDNQYATLARPVTARGTRPLSEIRYELGRLLYHELTHASDFLPPSVHASLNPARKVFEASPSQTPSQMLQQQAPFLSSVMVELGRVLFHGLTATAQQNSYLPADIVAFFRPDRVNDDYSYSLAPGASVPREDAAMLVEEALMQLRYGVMRDFAVTNKLVDGASSADLTVTWGQRGRIGEAAIKPRARLVLAETMPWLAASELDRLAVPLTLRAGLSWGQNLDQGAIAAARPRALNALERAREDELEQERRQRRAASR